MGVNNSKDSKMNTIMKNLLADYIVVQEVEEQHLLYLQEKNTHEEFLLREFNFTDRKACDQLMHKLKKLKSQLEANKHVVDLDKYQLVSEDGYCSKFFRVYALFKYPHRTLDDEITDRRIHQRRFLQTELWSILASCILGLGHLQKKGIRHSAVKSTAILVYNDGLSNEGILKVSVPFATAQQSIYDVALMKRSGKHLYLSPELCKSLSKELIVPEANQYKSDTWALALTILQAGLLEYQDDIYRDSFTKINYETLNNKLARFGEQYSDKLKKMLEVMLDRCQSSRPDWIELETHVALNQTDQEGTIHSSSSIQIASGKRNQYSTESKPINFFSNNKNLKKNSNNLFDSAQISPFAKPLNDSRPSSVPLFTPQKDLFQTFQNPPYDQNYGNTTDRYGGTQRGSPFSTNLGSQPEVRQTLSRPQYAIVRSGKDNQMETKIYPSRINNLDFLRPSKNIFPQSTYITKTKPDENLLIKSNQDQDYSSYPSIQFNLSSQLSNQMNEQFALNGDISQQFITESYLPINSDRNQLEFVEEIYNMGSKYIGNKLNGQRHGQGKFYYQDGGLYDGEWKQNKMDGYGKLYYQSGKLAYEGNWKQDKFYGKGILYNESPDYLLEPFDCSNLEDVGESWSKYEGLFINDLKHGNGILYLSNGQNFRGNFQFDVAQGAGAFTSVDERQTRGIWSNNHKIG